MTMNDSASLLSIVGERAEARKKELQKINQTFRKNLRYLSDVEEDDLVFEVRLASLWSDHGEKDVCVQQKAPLEQVISLAVEKFKRVNKRKDVQADWCVGVVCPFGFTVPVPDKFWNKYRK